MPENVAAVHVPLLTAGTAVMAHCCIVVLILISGSENSISVVFRLAVGVRNGVVRPGFLVTVGLFDSV